MMNQFIQRFNAELVAGVGLNSSYADDKIENIQRRLPETIVTESFLGILPANIEPDQYEIGQTFAKHWGYRISLIIMVKSYDNDAGLEKLDKLVKRVMKCLSSSQVLTENYADGTIKETPYKFELGGIDYQGAEGEKANVYVAELKLLIKTQLTI